MHAGVSGNRVGCFRKICKEAERLIKRKVICIRFEELQFQQEFDGIWACASLLHVPYEEISGVLKRLREALKEDGILYASFKYGKGMRMDQNRIFYDYEEALPESLMGNNCFAVENIFRTRDVRKGRENEQWVNVLARKRSFFREMDVRVNESF